MTSAARTSAGVESGVRPRLGVHRFGGCGGCLLGLLADGAIAALAQAYRIVHWPAVGVADAEAEVDVAVVEGSVSTPGERDRLRRLRPRPGRLVVLRVCATAGGPQGLRAFAVDRADWPASVGVPVPEPLDVPAPVGDLVRVDHSLWGCPVEPGRVVAVLRQLADGIVPAAERRTVCAQCKLAGAPCVWVSRGAPCLGPVTRAGCGGLCPRHARACYGCFGPAEEPAAAAFAASLARLDPAVAARVLRLPFLAGAGSPVGVGGPAVGPGDGPEVV